MFRKDTGQRVQGIACLFSDDTKECVRAKIKDGEQRLWKDLVRLEEWSSIYHLTLTAKNFKVIAICGQQSKGDA